MGECRDAELEEAKERIARRNAVLRRIATNTRSAALRLVSDPGEDRANTQANLKIGLFQEVSGGSVPVGGVDDRDIVLVDATCMTRPREGLVDGRLVDGRLVDVLVVEVNAKIRRRGGVGARQAWPVVVVRGWRRTVNPVGVVKYERSWEP